MTDCHSVTKSGEKCKRQALPGRHYCWQHDSKWIKGFTLGGVVTILLSIIGLLADLAGLGVPISLFPGIQPEAALDDQVKSGILRSIEKKTTWV